jgi:hypothetical protein
MNRVNEPFDFPFNSGGELYLNYLVCQQFERANRRVEWNNRFFVFVSKNDNAFALRQARLEFAASNASII